MNWKAIGIGIIIFVIAAAAALGAACYLEARAGGCQVASFERPFGGD